jgi:hypothetical protein
MRRNVTIAADTASANFSRPVSAAAWRKVIAGLRGNALPIAITLGSLFSGAIYTWFMGEDANWDWQNYHEYNVWAVLNGRYDTDALPAGFQTFFNPAVYFPVYALRHLLPAPYGLLIIGAVHGLNLSLVYVLSRVLLQNSATAVAASILIAAFGPMTLSEIGTSFSDILTALPIVAGFILILSTDRSHRLRYLLAGLLLGAAVGLKLTNVVFALGGAAAVLLSTRPLVAMICLGLGGAIGGLATGGAWSLMLWREMGNPIFPLFNGVFQSKELLPNNIMDMQFMPRGIWDALAYPFYWMLGDNRSSEYPFRDARFAVAMVLMLAGTAMRFARRAAVFTRRDIQFFVIFAVSYAAWLGLFSIQRYAIVLELLCGPLIVLLLSRAMTGAPGTAPGDRRSMPANAAVMAVAVAIALWSQPGDWWRRPWSDPYQPKISARLDQPASYFLLDKPIAYVAPQLFPRSRFYQIADIALPVMPDGKFDRRIRAGLADPLPGGAWELHIRGKPVRQELLERYGLATDTSRPCVEIEGAQVGSAIEACPLRVSEK